ncbi:major facilitator superfamily domain-containing protein [Lophiotrema nucula]|uniref:Major facilitator superfamily domain-containing protein n=1 Tax=Lophiotrema nucula TaxID=690887 RepID=A0A6A5ZLE2_9PLEO|nr:major facilitator superfamily domain-containing protein [Lophiotrema nucula]
MGGGGMGVMVAIILNDLIPLSLRGVWQGSFQWLVLLGNLSGSQVGGAVVDGPGWRIAFLIETPIAVVTFCLVLYTLKLPTLPTQEQDQSASFRDQVKVLSNVDFDFGGAALLMIALTALTISLATAGNHVPWSHPSVLTLLPVGIVGLACFLFFESRWASLPLIPTQELRRRDLWSIFGLTFFEDFSLAAFMLLTPIYVRVNAVGPTSTAGLYLSMVFLGLALGQTIAGGLVKWVRIPWAILLGAEGAVIVITVLLQECWKAQNSKGEDLVELLLLGLTHGAIKCILLVQLLQATSKTSKLLARETKY